MLQQNNNFALKQSEDVLSIAEDIIDNLDERALQELGAGSESDVDDILQIILEEGRNVLAVPTKKLDAARFDSLDPLIDSVEETLRKRSFNYFLLSVMPDFHLEAFHLEWGNLTQIYKYLGIEAARGHGKSVAPDTEVLMFDGSTKRADELVVGDLLMGPDSKSRTVTNLGRGNTKMYRVNQSRGRSYVVNRHHTLSLYKKRKELRNISRVPELVDMDIEDFIKQADSYKKRWIKGYKVSIDYPHKEVPIDPYYLGVWMGDGTESTPNLITNADEEVIEFLHEYASRFGLKVFTKEDGLHHRISPEVKIHREYNPINVLFKENNLKDNKHIPEDYIINSREVRLKFLAGIFDTDGHMSKNCMIFKQSKAHEGIVDSVIRICHSLGLRCTKTEKDECVEGKFYPMIRVCVTGEELINIPFKVVRKRPTCTGSSKSMFKRPKIYLDPEQGNLNYNISNVSRLTVEDIGDGDYVSISIDEDRRFLLSDNTVVHNSFFFSKGYPLWQLYRYQKDTILKRAPKEYKMSASGVLITNEYKLAIHLLGIVKDEIEENPILREKLYPEGRRDGWGAESITAKNGAKIYAKSVGSKMRGYHPTWIVCDDYLNDQVLYSTEQNNKYINHFHSVTMNMIEPNGQVICVGTPFREDDLYANLKSSNQWKIFEYPAIYPDGRCLWPSRHNLESILDKRITQGSTIFSREMLVRPISTESSLFPFPVLKECFDQKLTLIPNIHSTTIKYKKVVLGCDFAISANVAADFSVFTVLGITDNDHYHILHMWRKKGSTHDEQTGVIKRLYNDFNVDVVLVEDNGFQKIFVQMLNEMGVPATGQTTTAQKKYDFEQGIPHIAALFEQRRIHIPRGDQASIDLMDILVAEFGSFTWDEDKKKIIGVAAHDDIPLSVWIAISAAAVGTFNFSFI